MPGSGLGLAIVRQVAERHGGSVEAGRAEPLGARFTLRVPGHPVPEAERAHSAVTGGSQRTLSGG